MKSMKNYCHFNVVVAFGDPSCYSFIARINRIYKNLRLNLKFKKEKKKKLIKYIKYY